LFTLGLVGLSIGVLRQTVKEIARQRGIGVRDVWVCGLASLALAVGAGVAGGVAGGMVGPVWTALAERWSWVDRPAVGRLIHQRQDLLVAVQDGVRTGSWLKILLPFVLGATLASCVYAAARRVLIRRWDVYGTVGIELGRECVLALSVAFLVALYCAYR